MILDRIPSNKFSDSFHAEQLKQMLTEARFHKHNKTFIAFNAMDITKGTFPLFFVEEFRILCNEVLKMNRKAVFQNGEEFLDMMNQPT